MTTYAPGSPILLPQEELSNLLTRGDIEVKHPGPGGAPVHSTGTPQGSHGGVTRKVLDTLDAFKKMHVAPTTLDLSQDIWLLREVATVSRGNGKNGTANAADDLLRAVNLLRTDDPRLKQTDTDDIVKMVKDASNQYRMTGNHSRAVSNARALRMSLQHPSFRSEEQRINLRDEEDLPRDVPVLLERMSGDASALKADVARQIAGDLDDETGSKLLQYSGASPGMAKFEGWKEEVASAVVGNWAASSNDRNAQGLALQRAAEIEFGIDGAAPWKYAPQSQTNYGSDEIHDVDLLVEGQRTLIRSMYERTQAMFAEEGITHVRLHRGQDIEEGWDARMRPLSSWSMSETTAASFAKDYGSVSEDRMMFVDVDADPEDAAAGAGIRNIRKGEYRGGVLLQATVPVSRILCTPKTGLGCLNESEMVVLGGPLTQMAEPLRETKHAGPGDHPGTGTPQIVHAIGAVLNLFNLNDGRGGFEKRVRVVADTIGIDPYDVDLKKMREHADLHEAEAVSRFPTKSPCWASKTIDFTVHRWLPGILAEKYPDLAQKLLDTSPRWGRLAQPDGTLPLPEMKHMGPGPHPSGTPQLVHAGPGGYDRLLAHLRDLSTRRPAGRETGIAARLHDVLEGGGIPDYQKTATDLSLTWLGDAAPLRAGADVNETTERARTYLRSLPTYDQNPSAHEQGVDILPDGSIFRDRILVGRGRSIPMDTAEYEGVDLAAHLHNHPRENPLSSGDLIVGIRNRVQRAEAITVEGRYAMLMDWSAEPDPETLLPNEAMDLVQRVHQYAVREYDAGRMTRQQIRYGTGDAVARLLVEHRPDVFTYEVDGPWDLSERWTDEQMEGVRP